jgi:hypothetical protein
MVKKAKSTMMGTAKSNLRRIQSAATTAASVAAAAAATAAVASIMKAFAWPRSEKTNFYEKKGDQLAAAQEASVDCLQ